MAYPNFTFSPSTDAYGLDETSVVEVVVICARSRDLVTKRMEKWFEAGWQLLQTEKSDGLERAMLYRCVDPNAH